MTAYNHHEKGSIKVWEERSPGVQLPAPPALGRPSEHRVAVEAAWRLRRWGSLESSQLS